jgi:hypothetical protein
MKKRLLLLGLAMSLLTGCSQELDKSTTKLAAKSSAAKTTVLQFMEQEEGIAPYPVRMLVNADYLRIDDGTDSSDFLLYDRKKQQIINVNHEDNLALVIERDPSLSAVGDKPGIDIVDNVTADMPTWEGKQALHKTIKSKIDTCYEVIAIPDLLPDVVTAMREYLLTLSYQQMRSLPQTPEHMRTPCMLVNLVHYPAKHLDFGFPLREWDYRGYVRELVSFDEQTVAKDLFTVDDSLRRSKLGVFGMQLLDNQ